ncbi:MAG: 3'-5' exonuclease [Endomicrobia bacterium]|nr:3'-5' exonuclease [Endomicrobiia bacterium]MCL2506919.1 3'-5' exonuclease [Endomicrobiia bacterium]
MDSKILYTKSPNNLVFLDIETTGLDCAKGAKIVEIAMLKLKDGVEERYEMLVNPGSSIPSECSKIHSIYDDMVLNAPKFADIAKDIADFIGAGTLVCHNAKFDLTFVCKELKESGINLKDVYYIDTLKLARRYFSFDSNVLGNIAETIGVEVGLKHRAMADVLTMFSVANYLFKNMYRKGIDSIEPDLFG